MPYVSNILPPELQHAPALLAGFLALLGLILWTAGVKIAKPLAALCMGTLLAALCACLLPNVFAINPWIAAVIGLAAGVVLGFFAFRLVQGLVLAVCLGILAAGTFYQFQGTSHTLPGIKTAIMHAGPALTPDNVMAALPQYVQAYMNTLAAQWMALPESMRHSMLAIAAGAAVLTMLVTWLLPRPTTWLMSAVGGVTLLLYGGCVLLNTYLPQYTRIIPAQPMTQLAILGGMVLAGMVIQRIFFWPGRIQPRANAMVPA